MGAGIQHSQGPVRAEAEDLPVELDASGGEIQPGGRICEERPLKVPRGHLVAQRFVCP